MTIMRDWSVERRTRRAAFRLDAPHLSWCHTMVMRRHLCSPALLLLLLCGCAAPSPPPDAAPPPASSAAPPASASTAAIPPVAGKRVSAHATGVGVSSESVMYRRVRVVFENPTGRPCAFTGYTLRWGPSSKTLPLQGLTLPPGETRERSARVNPGEDGYDALEHFDVAKMTVEVRSDCPAEP